MQEADWKVRHKGLCGQYDAAAKAAVKSASRTLTDVHLVPGVSVPVSCIQLLSMYNAWQASSSEGREDKKHYGIQA